jgi:aminoglycoside phosphotransferase (APT) family kinase protein
MAEPLWSACVKSAGLKVPGMDADDEILPGIDLPLVRRLISEQFPQWADLPVTEVRSAGTDNVLCRLGHQLAVRLPRHRGAAADVARQQRWLPRLAPLLPLAVPVPLAQGNPGPGFPFPWLVYRWLDGRNVADEPDVDLPDAAVRLGRFVAALERIDATGGPPSFRGGPVSMLDDRVRGEIRALAADGTVDPQLAAAAWQTALAAPAWAGPRVWVHADLYPVNLLARHGQLAAVIDFGGLGVGDPAIDMLPAWAWLTGRSRDLFRAEVQADDATWARGRGWALALGLGAAHFYRITNPVLAAIGQHAIAQVIADQQRTN